LNNYEDMDGCADQGVKGGPKLTNDRVDLQGDRIEFVGKTDKLNKAGYATLDDVATEMKRVPKTRFRIEVGVEETSKKPKDKKADQQLTQKRADQIRAYLISKGVPQESLDAVGLGSDRPVDRDPKSAKNRRVEFIRLNQ
jgi:type VI secretion system protein ImpL